MVPSERRSDNEIASQDGLDSTKETVEQPLIPTQSAVTIDLPVLAGSRVERGEPTAPPAESIDALEVSEVENFPRLLGSVSDNRCFARDVWPRHAELQ